MNVQDDCTGPRTRWPLSLSPNASINAKPLLLVFTKDTIPHSLESSGFFRKSQKGFWMIRKVTEVSRAYRGSVATRCVTALACLLLFALPAFGQEGNGTITGTITDASGAVAPNVAIDVKNADTGAVFHSGTSNTGNYVVPVPAGKYAVTVTASGFKKYVRSNLVVQTANDTRLDVTLELGALTDTITVTDTAP